MSEDAERNQRIESMWRVYMTTGEIPQSANPRWFEAKVLKPIVRMLPRSPRCRICYYPFEGVGGAIARTVLGVRRAKLNPQLCNICESMAERYRGGAELDLTMLFADIRGSTALAEQISPAQFSGLIDRFYRAATKELFNRNALVEKLIGDEVSAFFVPGFAGQAHARVAVAAGQAILRATGHSDPEGPWAPVGVGIHTGKAFVGAVSAEGGTAEITALGDTPNTASRITAEAAIGEVLISEATREAAGIEAAGLKHRRLELKGKEEPVEAWAIGPAHPS
jgi:adenylate cyclase